MAQMWHIFEITKKVKTQKSFGIGGAPDRTWTWNLL